MSLETWKAEFYPVDAKDVSEADALAHSLRKWEGLRADALVRHSLTKQGKAIGDDPVSPMMAVDVGTCALCVHYARSNRGRGFCDQCPLKAARGRACDSPGNDWKSPYSRWVFDGNPEPMIALIQLAIRHRDAKATVPQ